MPISVQCPECYKQYRIKDEFAGMRMRCAQCGHGFVVSGTASPEHDPSSGAASGTMAGGTPPDAFDAERTAIEYPGAAGPPPVPPAVSRPLSPTEPAAVPVSAGDSGPIQFGTVLDFAQDWAMVSYVLEWVGLCTITALVSGGLSWFIPSPYGIIVGGVLLAIALLASSLGIICGISHMTGIKLATGTAPGTPAAWNVYQRRFFSLTVGTLGIWLGSVIGIILIGALIAFMSYSPYVGQLLGGVLMIPTFVGVVFAFALLFNLYLLPVAIGVEDCSAREAFDRLRTLIAAQRFALYARYFSAAFNLIPAIITTLVMTAIPLAAAFALCGVRYWIDGPGIESALLLISTAAIVLSAIAYGVVLVTVALALVYCRSTGRETAAH